MFDLRREFLAKVRDLNNLQGLEIGALSSPIVDRERDKQNYKISYLDHLSTPDLKDKYRSDASVNIDEIVLVDFVCPDGDIVKAVGQTKFDYVVASHVVEHSPNFLEFLSAIFDILKPGGMAFFVVPDKRFTFDANRPLTSFGTVLERYLSGEIKPGVAAVYDHFATANAVDADKVWAGLTDPSTSPLLTSQVYAWEAANNVKEHGAYFDVHVNIFTPYNFFKIIESAVVHDVVMFEVENFQDTLPGQLEFMVALTKPFEPNLSLIKTQCLSSIPKLKLESILAPYMPQVKSLSKALEEVTGVTSKLQQELEELREESRLASIHERGERERLQVALKTAQQMLNRKSVKLILSVVHKLYSTFRLSENKKEDG